MTTPGTAAELSTALASEAPLTWLLTGDSITHGLVHTQGARTYADHLHEIIRGEMVRTRDVVINTAISGHRLTDILGDWERRVSAWNPDVVTIMIGTNDCAEQQDRPFITADGYAERLREFVAAVRDLGAIPVLLTPPSVNALLAPDRARIGEFADAVRDVAREEETLLVDIFARFDLLGLGRFPEALMNDAFHPNSAGHAAIGLEIARVLGLNPEESRTIPSLEAQVELARNRF